ncbi:hypothetical protein [Geomonas agri]|uniref:hypothetical protein n=1 Tax=Geomonas agri TaxID=2873702 RepID=UPI001CD68467|nr:hypothetical protein [Geomonas agri]
MSDSSLIDAVSEAAYSEFNQLVSMYQRTDGLENCIHLMQPNVIIEIVQNASNNLAELGVDVMNSMYEFYYDRLDYQQKMNYQPSLKIQKGLHGSLLEGSDALQREIDHYGVVFNRSLERLQHGSGANSIGGAALGGVIGSIFGPIGSVLGGLAGGALAGDAANNDLSQVAQQLCVEFGHVVESTNTFLETMANRMLETIRKYNLLFEGDSMLNY